MNGKIVKLWLFRERMKSSTVHYESFRGVAPNVSNKQTVQNTEDTRNHAGSQNQYIVPDWNFQGRNLNDLFLF